MAGITRKYKLLSVSLTAAALFFVVPGAAFEHYGAAACDMTKLATVKGPVTDFQLINPHV